METELIKNPAFSVHNEITDCVTTNKLHPYDIKRVNRYKAKLFLLNEDSSFAKDLIFKKSMHKKKKIPSDNLLDVIPLQIRNYGNIPIFLHNSVILIK